MSKNKLLVALAVVGVLSVGGCSKAKRLLGSLQEKPAGAAEAEGEAAGEAAAEPELVAGDASGPASLKWERAEQAGIGSIEIPSGDGWTKEQGPALEVHNETLDVTVMVQKQAGVPSEARSEYVASLIDANKRDAPKYQVVTKAEGSVNRQPAGRVDGTFDNGTAYATRDYALFAKDSVLVLMVRGPVAKSADVQGIADHMAKSFR